MPEMNAPSHYSMRVAGLPLMNDISRAKSAFLLRFVRSGTQLPIPVDGFLRGDLEVPPSGLTADGAVDIEGRLDDRTTS